MRNNHNKYSLKLFNLKSTSFDATKVNKLYIQGE